MVLSFNVQKEEKQGKQNTECARGFKRAGMLSSIAHNMSIKVGGIILKNNYMRAVWKSSYSKSMGKWAEKRGVQEEY